MGTFQGKQMSLYDVWDKGISEIMRTQESGFWLGGWTHVRAISEEFQKDKDLWKQEGANKAFDKWLAESVDFACNKAYTHPTNGKKLAGPNAEAGQVIDENAYQVWREQWLRQVLLAGERTAIVLNDILDAGGAAKIAEGSKVQTNADVEKEKERKEWDKERDKMRKLERAARGNPHINLPVLMTNFCIAAVTVPLFLLVANYGLNPKTYQALVKSLLEGESAAGDGGGRATKRTN